MHEVPRLRTKVGLRKRPDCRGTKRPVPESPHLSDLVQHFYFPDFPGGAAAPLSRPTGLQDSLAGLIELQPGWLSSLLV